MFGVFAALFLAIGVHGTYLAIIVHKARKKARFALEYGVWCRDQYGRELLLKYHDSLSVNMDHVLDWRCWSVPATLEDRWVPLWQHCEEVRPMVVSNEQLLYIARRLEWAEKGLKLGKSSIFELKEGYEMRVGIKEFQSTVNEAIGGINDGENCIIDIFTNNGMDWKTGPKQPENNPIMPNKTSN